MSHVDDGLLHAYLDGELPASEAERLAAHVAECAHCRSRLEEERALIRRASELLALAEPPARDVPPFRAGDLRPPARLWWQVRSPLAWAATVVLGLGIGWYLGGITGRSIATVASDSAARAALAGAVALQPSTGRQEPRPAVVVHKPAAVPAEARRLAANEAAGALAQRGREESIPAVAPEAPVLRAERAAAQTLSLDSARALLDADLLALPGVPIESIRLVPSLGETVIVVQQPLDSTTTIELEHRRPSNVAMDAVVVTGAPEPQRQRGETARAAAKPSPAAKMAVRTPAPGPISGYAEGLRRSWSGVTVEIKGPLPEDSLRKLLERARPIP